MKLNLNFTKMVGGTFASSITGYTIPQIIIAGVNLLFGLAGVVSFIFLVWGGLQWVLAGGDKEGLDKARKRITGALVGLALVFSVYALEGVLGTFFAVNVFNICIPGIGRTCGGSSSTGTQVSCSGSCKSNPDGSDHLCYSQTDTRDPGNAEQVYCGSGGFRCDPAPCAL